MKKIITLLFIVFFAVAAYSEDKADKKEPAKKEKSSEDYIKDLNAGKSEKLIIEAADWAAKEEEKDAVPNLIKLLDDSRVNVRLHSAMALGYIGDESAAKAINKVFLNDSSPEVRYAAILSSFRIGSDDSIDAWKKAKEKETDPYIKDILKKLEEKAKGD